VVLEVMPRAEELGLEVTVEKTQSVPPIMGDPDKLKEVFINIIGNAMKFTQKGGKITITFTQLEQRLEITISDNGSGIAAEDLPRLFQKFGLLPGAYSVSGTTSQGSGLGLYICKKIIELHHGSIEATSPGVGKGTKIIIMLPIYDEKAWQQYKLQQSQE
jgi:signal transduction histidine kinase